MLQVERALWRQAPKVAAHPKAATIRPYFFFNERLQKFDYALGLKARGVLNLYHGFHYDEGHCLWPAGKRTQHADGVKERVSSSSARWHPFKSLRLLRELQVAGEGGVDLFCQVPRLLPCSFPLFRCPPRLQAQLVWQSDSVGWVISNLNH